MMQASLQPQRVPVAVFVSGGGTNLQALIDCESAGALAPAHIALVISDRKDAFAMERARRAHIDTLTLTSSEARGEAWDHQVLSALRKHQIQLVVLAGFLRVLSATLIHSFDGPILNIHPALLPSFGGRGYYGLRVHEAVLAARVQVSGATVHVVSPETDGGPIVAQKAVPVLPGDTPERLQERIMVQAERKLLPAATRVFALRLQQGFRGDALLAPLDPQDLQSVQLPELLRGNPYPGRGIALAHGPAGETLAAYFIMGRSANSRNRVFRFDGQDLFTEPHDPKQVEDPSLIIYRALSHPTIGHETATLVTNGDQTDTILNALKKQQSFTEALQTRRFEPDAPNFTPRISGLLFADRIEMAILKAQDSEGKHNSFHSYRYEAEPGIGRFLSTYQTDGNPLPSFAGEPLRFLWDGDAQTFAERLWRALDPQNRIALFIEATDSAGTAHFQFSRFEEKL